MWTVVNKQTETTDDEAKFLFSAVGKSVFLTPHRHLLEMKCCHGTSQAFGLMENRETSQRMKNISNMCVKRGRIMERKRDTL